MMNILNSIKYHNLESALTFTVVAIFDQQRAF